ncbi:hypothetical protein Moror_591 [Moniliophthora roreri MCA 2997]|uniref:Uncharacterized protein n=1 Tax=Moniliophthora roreri (strain MCA 2997) TaxID=1381753 RepID=V2XZC9_MONRO|nr:hypothetical protein Moror_591 [Moniliophthora roreri MCA 2997]
MGAASLHIPPESLPVARAMEHLENLMNKDPNVLEPVLNNEREGSLSIAAEYERDTISLLTPAPSIPAPQSSLASLEASNAGKGVEQQGHRGDSTCHELVTLSCQAL